MSEFDLKTYKNKEYLKLINSINTRVDRFVITLSKKVEDDLEKHIKISANRFSNAEYKIREKFLGIDKTASYSRQTDFKNRTEDMKNHTGFILYYNGIAIAQKGIIEKGKGGLVNINPISHIGSSLSKNETGKSRKNAKKIPINRYINLAIFTTSEHSGYVENIDRKRRIQTKEQRDKSEKGTLYQGTGWFQLYTNALLSAFYENFDMNDFLKNELNILTSNSPNVINTQKNTEEFFKMINVEKNVKFVYQCRDYEGKHIERTKSMKL